MTAVNSFLEVMRTSSIKLYAVTRPTIFKLKHQSAGRSQVTSCALFGECRSTKPHPAVNTSRLALRSAAPYAHDGGKPQSVDFPGPVPHLQQRYPHGSCPCSDDCSEIDIAVCRSPPRQKMSQFSDLRIVFLHFRLLVLIF